MRQENVVVIPVQAAATITSSAIDARNLIQVSLQVVTTGSSAGTAKLQASNDVPTSPTTPPTNWSDIPSATIAVSGAGAVLIPKTEICYEYIRIVYTNTGTGTVGARLKAIGE